MTLQGETSTVDDWRQLYKWPPLHFVLHAAKSAPQCSDRT